MKKFALCLIALMSTMTHTAMAENPNASLRPSYGKNEISASYGLLSANRAYHGVIKLFTFGFAHTNTMSTGTASIGYLRYVHDVVGIGVIGAYEYGWHNDTGYYGGSYTSHQHYLTMMAQVKLYWFNRRYVGMYSRFAAGAQYSQGTFSTEAVPTWRAALQLSPICLEAGGRVRGFLELGIGDIGYLNVGVKVNF